MMSLIVRFLGRLSLTAFVLMAVIPARAQVRPDSMEAALLRQSVQAVLGTSDPIMWHGIPVTEALRTSLHKKLKRRRPLPDTLFIGTIKTRDGLRYLIPDEAPSRSEKFSFVLYLDEAGGVVDVDVLKYNENYGAEIDYPLFRKQFLTRKKPKEIIFRRTIQNISGATISARSLTYAVHDLLALVTAIGPNHLSAP